MKKLHIVLLLLVVAGIVGMSFFIKDLTTQETFKSALDKKEKYVVVKAKLDKATPIEYDAVKNPNMTCVLCP
jgi:cytochrome c-type biogenesis protein CcmE